MRADVQIGGGVHVGDAFQAIVSIRPIAMWACVALCPNFSEDGTSTSRQTTRERRRCQTTVGNAEARGAVEQRSRWNGVRPGSCRWSPDAGEAEL